MARFVLVPGFWLGGWAWDQVAEILQAQGHEVAAVTLPGLAKASSERGTIRLEAHVSAVVKALRDSDEPSVLVGHSGAGAVIYTATDRQPMLVSRAVYVDSGPLPDGAAIGFDGDPRAKEIPLPTWAEMAERGTSVDGLSPEQLEQFRDRALPHPVGPAKDPVRLADPRRYRVPVTLISCSFPSEEIRRMTAEGHPFFAELTHLDVTIVDLPTGHWPMWSRPADLAAELVKAAPVETASD